MNATTPRWLRALAVGLLGASSPSIAACHAECNAMDAEGVGDCDFGLGYARREGLADCACGPVIGCTCEGEDCGELFVSYADCADTLRLE